MKATVRGEQVVILKENVVGGDRRKGILGEVTQEATTLVEYGDGEWGYVKPNEVVKQDAEAD